MPGFLHRSERLTILWSSEWSSRLWCIFELAAFLNDSRQKGLSRTAKAIQLVPVRMATVLLLEVICWVSLAVTHAVMLDLLSPYQSGDTDSLPQVRQKLFNFYLLTFGTFLFVIVLVLPSFVYIGQMLIRELAALPAELKEFRVQDVKCFCCTNNHYDPITGEVIPCDRVLVHRMLARWFSTLEEGEDDFTYLDRFNTVVREELSIVVLSAGGTTLRFNDAFRAVWGCTIPWISDYIPWWANSDYSGVDFFLWFVRGLMLWSFNGLSMLVMMRMCIVIWKLSLGFLDGVPRVVVVLAQTMAVLISAVFVWLPFRWWYVT